MQDQTQTAYVSRGAKSATLTCASCPTGNQFRRDIPQEATSITCPNGHSITLKRY